MKLWRVFKSVCAAMVGVQSEHNRQQDFSQSSALPYLIVGVIFVVFFVLGLIMLVNQLAN